MVWLHLGQEMVISSTYGLCRSRSSKYLPRPLRKLPHAANTIIMPAPVTVPDGDGRAPVPLPRHCPVHVVPQPLAKPPLPDIAGVPVYLAIPADQPVHSPPSSGCTKRSWRNRATACCSASRRGMYAGTTSRRCSSLPVRQVGHDVLIGLFDKLPGKGIRACDVPQQVHVLHEVQAWFWRPCPQVLISKGRRNVHYPRAVLHGHEISLDNSGPKPLSPLELAPVRSRRALDVREKRADIHPILARVVIQRTRR